MTLYVGECRRCGAQRMAFEVYGMCVAVDCREEGSLRDDTIYTRIIELACQCRECNRTTVFLLQAQTSAKHELPKTRFDANENPLKFGYAEFRAFPTSVAGPTPAATPQPAANFYHQGITALGHGLNDAAGCMFRKCLEAATRSDELTRMIPEGEREEYGRKWLKARLTKLKEIHAIPPALADLVDVIKDEGDAAVHENQLYDKASAEALQGFTETFLEQMFTLPAQIKKVRAKKGK